MNPHQLEEMTIHGGMGRMSISWKCSCGESVVITQAHHAVGLSNWTNLTETAFTSHARHAAAGGDE